MLQQANAAGSRVAPQPPQPYTLDSNIVAPGTVSVQQARPPAGFAFAKETAQRSVADWLAQVEHFCVSMRVAHPVALAGNYLEGAALLWYLQWKGDSDPHDLVWSSFRRAILSSNLVKKICHKLSGDQLVEFNDDDRTFNIIFSQNFDNDGLLSKLPYKDEEEFLTDQYFLA